MLRRANRAQAGIQRLHDQALVGAACPAVGFAKEEAFACWHSASTEPSAVTPGGSGRRSKGDTRTIRGEIPLKTCSSCLQLAHMGDITVGDWPEPVAIYGGHRQGASVECGKFHFISRPALVDVDHRADISRLKLFAGQIRRQPHAIMFFDLYQSSKGYARNFSRSTMSLSALGNFIWRASISVMVSRKSRTKRGDSDASWPVERAARALVAGKIKTFAAGETLQFWQGL